MKKNLLLSSLIFGAAAVLSYSCQDAKIEVPTPTDGISFKSSIQTGSKATDVAFEVGDEIGVTAFDDADFLNIYADNVAYTYDATGSFTSTTPISYPDGGSLAFVAFYPTLEDGYSEEFEFEVNADQSNYENYTNSDLMVAQVDPTTELVPELVFSHKLSRINLTINTEADLTNAVVKFLNVKTGVSVYLNDNWYEGTGATNSITLLAHGDDTFKAILAPQEIAKGTDFVSVELDGKEYITAIEGNATLKSGKQYSYALDLDVENNSLTFDPKINPWEDGELYEKVEYVVFTDKNFEDAVFAVSTEGINTPGYIGNIPQQIDADSDGKISYEEAAAVTQLGLDECEVGNFEGLEHFTGVKMIYANGHAASEIDLTKCTELALLSLHSFNGNAHITSIDFSQNTKLEYLDLIGTSLTSLDVSNNPKLSVLFTAGGYCDLGALDLSANKEIVNIDIESSGVTSLNIEGCTNIFSLSCGSNEITDLDLSDAAELRQLMCAANPLESLNISNSTKLSYLMIDNTLLSTVNVSNNVALEYFYALDCKLTTLDVSTQTKLKAFEVQGNELSELDVTDMLSTGYVYCGNQLAADGTVTRELTLTMTKEQSENSQFFAPTYPINANVVVVVEGEETGGGDEPTDVVITTTLSTIPTDGSVGPGTWVITDEFARGSFFFPKLKEAIALAGGEVKLWFPNIDKLPMTALGHNPSNPDDYNLENLVSVKLDKATQLSSYCLSGCANLREINAPMVVTTEDYAVSSLTSLEKVTMCTKGSSAGISTEMFGTRILNNLTLVVGADAVTGGVTETVMGSPTWRPTASSDKLSVKEVIVAE